MRKQVLCTFYCLETNKWDLDSKNSAKNIKDTVGYINLRVEFINEYKAKLYVSRYCIQRR